MATARQLEHPKAGLYEQDFFAWVQDQAEALRAQQAGALDWENLLEEIESMGRSERNALESRLSLLLTLLMKWQWQPEKRSKSWMQTIREQRKAIRKILKRVPPACEITSLKPPFQGADGPLHARLTPSKASVQSSAGAAGGVMSRIARPLHTVQNPPLHEGDPCLTI
ncbi:MAG TPA: DUF29 domain-containing protein [Acidithiobacillus sp.]|nr:DUF29 domain-containing protein [Acidithiobacillus sp.]